MNLVLRQLVLALCGAAGLSPTYSAVVLQLLAALPEERLRAVALEAWRWLESRPRGPDGNPDMGGNEQATNPPIELDQPAGDAQPLP